MFRYRVHFLAQSLWIQKILFVRWIGPYTFIRDPRSIGVYGLHIFSLGSDVGFLLNFPESWKLPIDNLLCTGFNLIRAHLQRVEKLVGWKPGWREVSLQLVSSEPHRVGKLVESKPGWRDVSIQLVSPDPHRGGNLVWGKLLPIINPKFCFYFWQ